MFSTIAPTGMPALDVGEEYITAGPQTADRIESEEQHALEELSRIIGKGQVTRKRLDGAPSLLLDKAVKDEIGKNWAGA